MRAIAALIAISLCLAFSPRVVPAQESAYRFAIAEAGDSTFVFPTERHGWVRAGMVGIAVDPVRRDALVARFRIVGVAQGRATALITGQTTRLTSDHVALLERPRPKWYSQKSFWLGTVLGAVIGAVVVGR